MRRKIIKRGEMRRKRKNEIIEVDRVLNHLNPVLVIIYSLQLFDSTSHKVQQVKQSKRDSPKKSKQQQQQEPLVEKPNFAASGILAQFAANNIGGTVLRFTEPLDALAPPTHQKWKLFPFKGDESLPSIFLKGKSNFLIGRDLKISDIPLQNPSISLQHAVIQFRQRRNMNEPLADPKVKPYIMDLETTNGTFLNGQRIEGARYYELIHSDVLKFGASERDFVLMLDEIND